jgi:hypothetical protein
MNDGLAVLMHLEGESLPEVLGRRQIKEGGTWNFNGSKPY